VPRQLPSNYKELNHYDLLDVPRNASNAEIRKAYRQLALVYHPDKNPGKDSTEKFKAIVLAMEILTDDTRRRQYDMALSSGNTENINNINANVNVDEAVSNILKMGVGLIFLGIFSAFRGYGDDLRAAVVENDVGAAQYAMGNGFFRDGASADINIEPNKSLLHYCFERGSAYKNMALAIIAEKKLFTLRDARLIAEQYDEDLIQAAVDTRRVSQTYFESFYQNNNCYANALIRAIVKNDVNVAKQAMNQGWLMRGASADTIISDNGKLKPILHYTLEKGDTYKEMTLIIIARKQHFSLKDICLIRDKHDSELISAVLKMGKVAKGSFIVPSYATRSYSTASAGNRGI